METQEISLFRWNIFRGILKRKYKFEAKDLFLGTEYFVCVEW